MPTWQKHVDELVAGRRAYTLVQGDCLDVGRRLPGEVADACVCDPPYGMRYRGLEDRRPPIANDERPFIWWLNDAYRVIKPGGALACFCQWKGQEDFKRAIELAGFQIRSQVIWDRMQHGMGHPGCTFGPRHDVVWFATKGRFRFPAGRPPSVLAHANVPARSRVHSTQKPDELMLRLVRHLVPAGGIVYDPCAGSGSTGAAAVAAGYRFLGIELDEVNHRIAAQRLREAERSRPKAKLAGRIHYTPLQRAVA